MKGISRKIALSVLALVLTLAATLTGAYAWFVVNNTAKVGQIGGTVESGTGGFMIAAKQGTKIEEWTTNIDLTDFAAIDLTDLTLDGANLVKRDSDTPNTSGYLTFDLYFAAGSTFSDVQLSELSITSVAATSWTAPSGLPTMGGITYSNHAANAARVGFFGESGLINAYEKAADADGTTAGNTAGNIGGNALTYYNEVSGSTVGVPITTYDVKSVADIANDVIIELRPSEKLPTDYPAATPSMTVGADAYSKFAKVTVKIWIEGWDGEAFNAILSGQFNVSMILKVA